MRAMIDRYFLKTYFSFSLRWEPGLLSHDYNLPTDGRVVGINSKKMRVLE
jgi:hypothetical protein